MSEWDGRVLEGDERAAEREAAEVEAGWGAFVSSEDEGSDPGAGEKLVLKSANVRHASHPNIATKSSPAEVDGGENPEKPSASAGTVSATPGGSAAVGGGEGGGVQTWAGVAKEGTYRALSATSPFCRWAPAVGPDGLDENMLKPGADVKSVKSVYYYVSVKKGHEKLFVGPGDVLVLNSGTRAVYLATATKKGCAPTLIVCSEEYTDTRAVEATELVSLVKPSGHVETAWVRPCLEQYLNGLREAAAQGRTNVLLFVLLKLTL